MTISSAKKISILIVSWNVAQYVDQCLASIFKFNQHLDVEVIVVDNASTDNTVEMLKRKYPQVKLIANSKNRGFAAANNQAVTAAQGDYVLFLNPDTEFVDSTSLPAAIEYLESHPQAGLLGWHVLNQDGTNQIAVRKFPTLYSQIITLLKLNNIFPGLNKHYFWRDFDYDITQPVETVIGACMLMRMQDYQAIGGLDNDYYIWFEEVDLCTRIWQSGRQVIYFAPAKILHYGGQSFKQMLSLDKQRIFNSSLIMYFKKNKPAWQTWVLKLFIPFNLLLTVIQQALNLHQDAY